MDKTHPKRPTTDEQKPSIEQVAWVFEKIANLIDNGGGTFRKLCYDYMGFDEKAYQPLYEAGGMLITNTIEETFENDSLKPNHKKAIEALEVVKIQLRHGNIVYALQDIDETISLIREGE